MTISFQCPACGRRMYIADDWAGKQVGCGCGKKTTVPATGGDTQRQKPPAPLLPVGAPSGIGGWLILPAILVASAPVVNAGGILISLAMLNSLLLGESEPGYPDLRLTIISQTIVSVLLLIFQILLAVVFFQKKPVVPKLMVAYLLIIVALPLVNVLWTLNELDLSDVQEIIRRTMPLIAAVVWAAIWIPYFLVSKRVKATFV